MPRKPSAKNSPPKTQPPPAPPPVAGEARLEWMRLPDLKKADRNPKGHDLPGIQAAFRRFGFIDPMVMNETTGQLVAGHGRTEALSLMKRAGEVPPARVRVADDGEWLAPVLRGVAFRNAQEAEAYLVASNQLTTAGKWDAAGLGAILADFTKLDVPLGGLGFTERQVQRLVGAPAVKNLTTPQLSGLTYSVVVEVNDEDAQTELLERLEGEGYKCKPLVT